MVQDLWLGPVPSPVTADEHVLKRLRIPLSESQPEFEAQVLNLAYYWSMR